MRRETKSRNARPATYVVHRLYRFEPIRPLCRHARAPCYEVETHTTTRNVHVLSVLAGSSACQMTPREQPLSGSTTVPRACPSAHAPHTSSRSRRAVRKKRKKKNGGHLMRTPLPSVVCQSRAFDGHSRIPSGIFSIALPTVIIAEDEMKSRRTSSNYTISRKRNVCLIKFNPPLRPESYPVV
ncbi:hypothetical protein PUN28_015583 [Cardiocondyla obscurior]|uniref:Uncharacterized protein n=1 Tax=Cardiocondyla obscurior TaxID=286306 RepID=A0AAW2EXN0_9HYME